MSFINQAKPEIFNLTPIPSQLEETYYNGTGLTPPMGWNSWPLFNSTINENKIISMAKAIKESGLADLGYIYINLDDSWQAPTRDSNNRLQLEPNKFPNGINYLVSTINNLGLKVGIYSCNGTLTHNQHLGSLNFEHIDAQTFADWGVEYLKYDYCFNIPFSTSAPLISSIEIKSIDNTLIKKFSAKDAILSGHAKLTDYNTPNTTSYITGLSSKNGFATFSNITVPTTSKYAVTVYYKNSGYFEIAINYGENIYAVSIPPSNNTNSSDSLTLNIQLNKGNNILMLSNPISNEKESTMRQYMKMGNALKTAIATKATQPNTPLKEIYFSISDWGINHPWEWGHYTGNCWRTTFDIAADWNNIMGIYNTNIHLHKYAGIGGFNDCDILQVGNGSLTYEENKSHFTLWCMMASPLILGNDIRLFINDDCSINTSSPIYNIITNKDLIAINQDSSCTQCRLFNTDRNVDILVKSLFNNDIALCFLNKGTTSQSSSLSILSLLKENYINLPKLPLYKAYNLWSKTSSSTTDLINVTIPSHGVKAFRICKYYDCELNESEDLSLKIDTTLEISSTIEVAAIFKNTGNKSIENISLSLKAPDIFKVTPISTTIPKLSSSENFTAKWTVTLPSLKGDYNLITEATFNYSLSSLTKTVSTSSFIKLLSTPKNGDILPNVDWINYYENCEKIRLNKSFYGNPLTINGSSYVSGIGTCTNSEIKVFTNGKSIKFSAIVGIDDETLGGSPLTGFPSAIFQVWGDDEKLYDSGIMRYKQSSNIYLDLTTYKIITFKTINGKNGRTLDHCDWINAYFKYNAPCTV